MDMLFSQQQPDGSTYQYRAAIKEVQEATENGHMVMYVREGQLVTRGAFFGSARSQLSEQFQAALRGNNLSDEQLNRSYASSVTAYVAANYRADTLSLIQIKVVDPAKKDTVLSPAHWYLQNQALINWQIEMSLILWGKAYLRKVRNPSGVPTGLTPLQPDTVRFDNYLFNGAGGWRVRIDDFGNEDILQPNELVYITTFDPASREGLSEYEVAMSDIVTEQGMSHYSGSFFVNRARPDGILLSSKPITDPKKQLKIEEEWKQFQSADNAFKTWITSGDWKFIPISQDFGDLSMPELSASVQRDIAMAMRVNPILIGAGTPSDPLSAQSTYASIERAHINSVTIPRLENLILAQLNRQWLWTDFSRRQHFTLTIDRTNTPALSNINTETVQQAGTMTTSGYATYDEARHVIGLDPDDDYITRDPQATLSMYDRGTIMLDEQRELVGLSGLAMGQGRVVKLADGTLIPVSRLMEIAQANADNLVNPPEQGGGFFGLSDIESLRTFFGEVVDNRLNSFMRGMYSRENVGFPQMSEYSANDHNELELDVVDGRVVMRNIDAVTIGLSLSNNAFVGYLMRELSRALVNHNILSVAWSNADNWYVPLMSFDNLQPSQAQHLINALDIDVDKVRGDLIGYQYEQASGEVRARIQGGQVDELVLYIANQAQQIGLTPSLYQDYSLTLGTVLEPLNDTSMLSQEQTFAASFDVVDIRFNGDSAHAWQLRHYNSRQINELKIWQRRQDRHNPTRRRPFSPFTPDELPQDVVNLVNWGLRLGGESDVVFDCARNMLRNQDELLIDDLATPDEYEAYWRNYDNLMDEVGDDWIEHYMTRAFDQVKSVFDRGLTPTQADIGDALRMNHDSLVEQWVGTDPENLGVLSQLVLAGQAAGNEAVVNNTPADYRSRLRGINGVISWELANEQAYNFARQYTFGLIRRIDNTTVNKIQDTIAEWSIEQGATLNDLEDLLEPIFNDRNRARTVAETESIRIYNEGAQERWRNVGVSQARWMTVRDSSVCPICEGLRGVVADFDAGFEHRGGVVINEETGAKVNADKFSGINYKPPAHPKCRCFLKPIVPDAGTLELPDGNPPNGGEDQDDRSSSDDPVPTDKLARYDERRALEFKEAFAEARSDLRQMREQIQEQYQTLAEQRNQLLSEDSAINKTESEQRRELLKTKLELGRELEPFLDPRSFGVDEPRDNLTPSETKRYNELLKQYNTVSEQREATITRHTETRQGRRDKIGGIRNRISKIFPDNLRSTFGDTPQPNLNVNFKAGSKAFKTKDDPRSTRTRDAIDYLNEIVDGDIHGQDIPITPKAKARGRAYYEPTRKEIHITRTNSIKTIVHEMAHAIEVSDPQILQRAIDFRNSRAVGSPQRLSKLTGTRGYKSDEVAYDDAWIHAYMGKQYLNARGDEYATEIISMGIDHLYTDAGDFAERDPEYFDFIVSVIQGLI